MRIWLPGWWVSTLTVAFLAAAVESASSSSSSPFVSTVLGELRSRIERKVQHFSSAIESCETVDTNKDGLVSRDEIAAFAKSLGVKCDTGDPKVEVETLFTKFDKNGDGVVQTSECDALAPVLPPTVGEVFQAIAKFTQGKDPEALFLEADKNGDGKISEEELVALLKEKGKELLGVELSEEDLKDLAKKVAAFVGGDDGEITKEQFIKNVEANQANLPAPTEAPPAPVEEEPSTPAAPVSPSSPPEAKPEPSPSPSPEPDELYSPLAGFGETVGQGDLGALTQQRERERERKGENEQEADTEKEKSVSARLLSSDGAASFLSVGPPAPLPFSPSVAVKKENLGRGRGRDGRESRRLLRADSVTKSKGGVWSLLQESGWMVAKSFVTAATGVHLPVS
uniref:EF-hand domain-containing protein n=1 Tax=Chromera velia CCMP2878 TaxID=1169474 RepID=A0A0G4FH66_9ALVE|mmetsp:Transcript_8474/g.16507  ORF Transcript_8474/g.16507 Transcript_8474/m.16507 type:complete len:397 (+) Transcript_8474:249-1439(+)|eukprot:Cvel_16958.t1-p1 / transcript=Cvel_16958.t1 / gene=Cvel_16958 / organism=Chromera_velia_CCMP2878 / gene_product=hypothetical protein / transcript_product=hypothetical protein / location=Cvel_scaffold1330:35094-39483(-) / protein_length=396 / sequence_SO=supercontig / SO=protein_coding / is_pseudo=false